MHHFKYWKLDRLTFPDCSRDICISSSATLFRSLRIIDLSSTSSFFLDIIINHCYHANTNAHTNTKTNVN